MTNEQIKQNAKEYMYFKQNELVNTLDLYSVREAYIAGAKSVLKELKLEHKMRIDLLNEVEQLKEEIKSLKETLTIRKAEIEDMEFLSRQDKELLNNAISMLKDVYEDDDYFCERLGDIPEENKICEECCGNLNEKCILRYLKYYKND